MVNIDDLIKQAKLGDSSAQYKLGRAFENGDGVEKDIDIAISWYKKSAANGNQSAKSKLLLMDITSEDGNDETDFQSSNISSSVSLVNEEYIVPPAPGPLYGGNALDVESNSKLNFETETKISRKRKIIAIILACFFGIVGAHDFYLGYTKRGIIKIILTITCIGIYVTGVWLFIDIILILLNKMKDRKGTN